MGCRSSPCTGPLLLSRMRILIYILLLKLSTISSSRNRRNDFAGEQDGLSTLPKSYDELEDSDHVFTNTWAVHVHGGPKVADEIALKHGFKCHGPLGSLKDLYLFEHSELKRRKRRSLEHHSRLASEPSVTWAEQQKVLSRKKRDTGDFQYPTDPLFSVQWYLKNTGMFTFVEIYYNSRRLRDPLGLTQYC